MTETKTCPECSTKITGRIDKKFCSDQCRITHNNRLNSDETNYVRNVNNILRRNRRILTELNTTGKTKVSTSRLRENGFDFRYFTNLYKTQDGAVYHYCYEQGYLAIENDFYLLVVKYDFK
jgi:hypothetical protein